MPIYALIIWTVISASPNGAFYDWRPIASFKGESLCKEGASKLGINVSRYRCIRLETQ
jgi:hypothetical protein